MSSSQQRENASPKATNGEYADLPPGIGISSRDEPLRRDINLLGRILGHVIAEQEGKSLFLTPPGDAAALADRLLPLFQQPEMRARMGRAAQVWARDRFSLSRHVA